MDRWIKCVVLQICLLGATDVVHAQGQNTCDCAEFRKVETAFFQVVLSGNRGRMQEMYDSFSKKSSPLCAAYALTLQAHLALFDGHPDSARALLAREQSELDQINCPSKNYVYLERLLGYIAFQQSDLEEAVRHTLKVAEICESQRDTAQQVTALMNVTTLLNQQGEHSRAIEILDKIRSIVDFTEHGSYYGNITEAYLNTYRTEYERTGSEAAKKKYIQWTFTNLEANRSSEAMVNRIRAFQNVALAASMRKDFQSCFSYADSARLIGGGALPPVLASSNFCLLAAGSSGLLHHVQAMAYADSSVQSAYQSGHPETILAALDAKYKVAKAAEKFQIALNALEQKVSLSDSIDNKERTAQVRGLELRYHKAKDEQTIHDLAQQQQITSLNNRLLLAALSALALIGVVLFVLYRQRELRHKQVILETEQRLNRARMNPHFFFNALSSLQTYSMKPGNSERVSLYLSKYSRIMRHTLEATYNDLISLEEELAYLTGYLEIESLRSSVAFAFSIDVDKDIDPSETMIPPMILQPFLENCIEHGFRDIDYEGVLQVSFIVDHSMLQVSISDNGNSTPNEQHKGYPSRATQIIRDRLFLLNQKHGCNASFEIRNTNGRGYTVLVQLPLLQTA